MMTRAPMMSSRSRSCRLSDDELEVEELPLSDDDTSRSRSCRSPRRRRRRACSRRAGSRAASRSKEFEVSEQDVRAQIFAQTAIPPELQILECDGVVVNDASNVMS